MPNKLKTSRPKFRETKGNDRNIFFGETTEMFSAASLKAKDRRQATKIGEITNALLLKSLLNRYDSQKFPLPKNISALENKISQIVLDKINAPVFKRIRPRLSKILGKTEKLKQALGPLSKIDFSQPSLKLNGLTMIPQANQPTALPEPEVLTPPKPATTTYNRLDLVFRNLHCVDETNPEGGADEIVFSGAKVEANGGTGVLYSFICGDYDTGDRHHFGDLWLAQYDLRSTSSYPKTVYAILNLVEADTDEQDVLDAMKSVISLAVTIVNFLFPGVGTVAGALFDKIMDFISLFIEDDYFPPYGISLTQISENQFSHPINADLSTGNITAHGGTYRISYKWIPNG